MFWAFASQGSSLMWTFVEICVDFGDAHFVTMQISLEIALQERPAYGMQGFDGIQYMSTITATSHA